ncbi:MAG: hypothetical protein KGZ58_12895 [Ignavibacteriales bacterium]|nr:hypothetical protein [Ignavibacteriales bacterium]
MSKKNHKTYILALDKDDPEKELEFEIMFQRTLTVEERYHIMDELVREGLKQIKKRGYKKTPLIVAR